MTVSIVNIVRKPGVPESPSPFLADGRPAWVAPCSKGAVLQIMTVVKRPNEAFKRDVESVHIDGVKVYPKE
jgi:hypothetical protein